MGKGEVKQKIIMKAIECIENEGIQGVTIRKIADRAGVNVAAINYHFGSKDQLLKVVMDETLEESFVQNIHDYDDMWQNKTEEALQNFLKDTLQGTINYPNITKAHLADVFIKSDYNTNSVKSINNFLLELHGLTKNILRSKGELKSKMAIVQLFSSFLTIGMMPELFDIFLGINLKEPKNREMFINILLENFIN